MSAELIASLERQLEKANKKLSNRTEQAKRYAKERDVARAEAVAAKTDLDARTKERDTAASERDSARGTPDDKDKRIAELEGTIRAGKHKEAFKRLAKDKIRDDAMDDAYALSGYTPEGDDIDEARLGDLIGATAKARPYLAPTATETVTNPADKGSPITTPRREAGPGAGRGVNDPPANALSRIDAEYGNRPVGRIA